MSGSPESTFRTPESLQQEARDVYDTLVPVEQIISHLTHLPPSVTEIVWELCLFSLEILSNDVLRQLREINDVLKMPLSDESRSLQEITTEYTTLGTATSAYEAWLSILLHRLQTLRTTEKEQLQTHRNMYYIDTTSNVAIVTSGLISWITHITNPTYWYGKPPFFAWIPTRFHSLPRVSRHDKNGERSTWASGFGGRLIVPQLSSLTSDQKDQMWSWLLINKHIYESESEEAKRRREKIMQSIHELIPPHTTMMIDACGGKGDFATWLRPKRPNMRTIIVDNASAAVEFAKEQRFQTHKADLENGFPPEIPQVEVITLLFGIQYLDTTALVHIHAQLADKGMLLLNVYPPEMSKVQLYTKDLLQAGFSTIKTVEISETHDHLLVAHK